MMGRNVTTLERLVMASLLAVASLSVGCKPSSGFKSGSPTPNGPGPQVGPISVGQPQVDNGASGQGVNPQAGTGGVIPPLPEEEPLNYPLLNFKAAGTMTYDGDKYGLTQEITAQMSKVNLVITTLKFNSDKSQVNKEVSKKVGADTFTRVANETLQNMRGFDNQPFLIYSTEVERKDKAKVRFTKPVPAFVVPGKANRFEKLNTGSIVYNADVTTEIGTVPVVFTVSKGVSPGLGMFVVELRMEIPSDTNGKHYGAIPIPRRSTYTIDTEKKLVTALVSNSPFANDRDMENIDLSYKLCSSTNNGQVENFTCP